MKKISLLLLLFASSTYATVSNGPYMGVEIGTDNQIINFQPGSFNLNTTGSQLYYPNFGFMGRLNFGYNFSKHSGIELAPSQMFTSNYPYPDGSGTMGVSTTSLDLTYIAYLPIVNSKWSVFGRVGVGYNWINNSNSAGCGCNNNNVYNPSGSNFADVLGAGVKYNLGTKASVRIEWIADGLLFPVGITSGGTNIANWTNQSFLIGFNYHF